MTCLKVLNVGQGDCIFIRPRNNCMYRNDVFYVDVGPGHTDVTKEITKDDRVHIILTHHHSDHVKGFKYFFKNFNQVVDITVPYCFNEISLIANAILHLKGIKSAPSCRDLINLLNDITDAQLDLKTILEKNKSIKINFAYDGFPLCHHMKFLNPYIDSELVHKLDETPENDFRELAFSLFEEEFANSLTRYVEAVKQGYGVNHAFYESFVYNRHSNYRYLSEGEGGEKTVDPLDEQIRAGCAIVVGFIKDNYEILQDFNSSPDLHRLQTIYENYTQNAHDVCLVMKAAFDPNRSILLTGDASKNVFYRLIDRGEDLHSYYLKVPHHGSQNNFDDIIFNAIDPNVAIISHKNGLFGRAKDPHPNKPVIDFLKASSATVAVTNDVEKEGSVYFRKTPFNDRYLEVE